MNVLQKKYFCEIIALLESEPLSFSEIMRKLNIYSDTLSRRLKELEEYDMIETIVTQEKDGKRVRYTLTAKGENIIPEVKQLMVLSDRVSEEILDRYKGY